MIDANGDEFTDLLSHYDWKGIQRDCHRGDTCVKQATHELEGPGSKDQNGERRTRPLLPYS